MELKLKLRIVIIPVLNNKMELVRTLCMVRTESSGGYAGIPEWFVRLLSRRSEHGERWLLNFGKN